MKYRLINQVNENYTPIQQILTNRGIALENIEHYLDTTDKDIIDYNLLDNIAAGAERLLKAIRNEEKILLITDPDCFTGDTKVKMLDGTNKSFEELVEFEKENPNSSYWVYSSTLDGEVVVGEAKNPRITKIVNEICKITFDNGAVVKCSTNHRFLTRDGKYVEAKDLTKDISLMPLYLKEQLSSNNYNHKIISIENEKLENPVNLYDITVEKYHNFALDLGDNSGVFVHNCDGLTSSSLLLNYLSIYFTNIYDIITYKLHENKEHGIEEKWLEEIIEEKYSLVICPDSSSNDYEQHRILKENGIDVLVIDQHEAEKVSENAIVINNQLCDYPTKSLSGVGIVYKFCCKLDEILGDGLAANNFLDLVALGMIADVMSLLDYETKHLINKGLNNISNPLFKALVEKQSYSLGGQVSSIGIAFYIAPLINATIRIGTQEEKEILFKAMLDKYANELIPSTKRGEKGKMETIVCQAVRNCVNIKNRQKKLRDEGLKYVEEIIQENELDKNKIILVKVNSTLNKNLTGLIANQLMSKYKKPVLLLRDTEDGFLQGSGRGYNRSELKDFKGFLKESNLAEYAEGHPNSFGLGISIEKVKDLIIYSNEKLKDVNFTACYEVDYIYNYDEVLEEDILEIASMKEVWGKDVEEALIVVKGVKIKENNITLMSPDKNPTLKIMLPTGVSLIKFGSCLEEYEELTDSGMTEIDIVGVCSINEWNGNRYAQIFINDYIITKKQKYYF